MSHVEVLDDVSVVLLPLDLHLQPPRLAREGGFARWGASHCKHTDGSPRPEILQARGEEKQQDTCSELTHFLQQAPENGLGAVG